MYSRGSRRSRGYGYRTSSSSYSRSYEDDGRRRTSYGRGGSSSSSGYLDSATQMAAANAILSALIKSQDRGYDRRYDYRDSYESAPFKRGRYISRRGYRGRGYQSTYRPSRPKGDGEKEEKLKSYKYRCHVCRTGTDTEKEHLDHLKEENHLKFMNRRKESYVRQIQAVVFKLRKFEDVGGPNPHGFCIVCNVGYSCTVARHNTSRLHKDMKNLKSAVCRYCDLQFNEKFEFDEHLLTIKHIETRAKALEEGKLIDMDELKIVDSVGDDDDEMEDLSFPDEYDENTAVGLQVVDNVTGYFCKACVTYFPDDICDSETHCKTKEHFDKFVEYAKTRKEKIEKLREEKAAAEEERKAAAEEDQGEAKEGNGEEEGDASENIDGEERSPEEVKPDEEVVETEEVNGEA